MQDDRDQKTNADLRAIREEMRQASEAERRRLFEAYVNTAHDGMQADIDDMPPLIIEFLKQNEARYPAVMDVCDGVHARAAGAIMGLMLTQNHDYMRGAWPQPWSLSECCDAFEEVCSIQICDLQDKAIANRGGLFRL